MNILIRLDGFTPRRYAAIKLWELSWAFGNTSRNIQRAIANLGHRIDDQDDWHPDYGDGYPDPAIDYPVQHIDCSQFGSIEDITGDIDPVYEAWQADRP